MNKSDFIKGLVISITTMLVGYVAVALPFHLVGNMTKDGERIFFIIELAIYLAVATIYLLIKDRQEKRAKKEKERHIKRMKKIDDVKANWYDVAA